MSRSLSIVLDGMVMDGHAAADSRYVKVVHDDTGKVLAIADISNEDGARAVLAKDGGGKGQQWRIEKGGDFLKLVNRKSGKVLDVFEDSRDEDAAIIQWFD